MNWTINLVLKEFTIIIKFLISIMGPIKRKAITGAIPKVDNKEAPIKASASLHNDKMKASNIITKMAVIGLCPIVVRTRVGK